MAQSNPEHYIDNKEFFHDMVEYKFEVMKAKHYGREKPQVPDHIASKIVMIAERLSYKPNFINYSYRDEMILDAIENCIQYASNFDGKKSKNPFAYFTQISYFAFVRRIQREKKQFKIKAKWVQNIDLDSLDAGGESSDVQEHDNDQSFDNGLMDHLRHYYEYELEEETADSKSTDKSKSEPEAKGLETFMEE